MVDLLFMDDDSGGYNFNGKTVKELQEENYPVRIHVREKEGKFNSQ